MRSSRPLAIFGLFALIASACSSTPEVPPPVETRCFSGDTSLAAEIEPVFRDVDGGMRPIVEGERVPLILPPQGGKVMIVGVRARNLDGCPLMITASIRDVCDQSLIALDRRPVTLEPKADGWLEPLLPDELVHYSNLPGCPRANLTRNVHGEPYLLTLRVEDKDGRKAETAVNVVPYCLEPEFQARCECECSATYQSGHECTGDAGTSSTSGTGCPGADGG